MYIWDAKTYHANFSLFFLVLFGLSDVLCFSSHHQNPDTICRTALRFSINALFFLGDGDCLVVDGSLESVALKKKKIVKSFRDGCSTFGLNP